MDRQLGFADALVNRKAGRNRKLEVIDRDVDWVRFEPLLPAPKPAGSAGRPGYPSLPMFKATLLAQWYQLSDPALEEALSDRLSFRRFCGFSLEDPIPDETTLCRFRNELVASGAGAALLAELDRQLCARGLIVKDGTMIDATLIEAQAARPKDPKEPAAPQGETEAASAATEPNVQPEGGTETSAARPDPHAAFARKGGKSVYGYKAHIGVDKGSGLIRRSALTPANVHDSTPADGLVMGDEKAVYADKAYCKHTRRRELKARGIKDRIMHRANKHQPQLPRWKLARNRLIARRRAAVERTFGIWKRAYGYTRVRYFSLAANALELQMKCFAFNLRRMAVLLAA